MCLETQDSKLVWFEKVSFLQGVTSIGKTAHFNRTETVANVPDISTCGSIDYLHFINVHFCAVCIFEHVHWTNGTCSKFRGRIWRSPFATSVGKNIRHFGLCARRTEESCQVQAVEERAKACGVSNRENWWVNFGSSMSFASSVFSDL